MLKPHPPHGERGVALEPPDRPRAHRRCLALVARGTAHVARSDIALDVSDRDVLQVDAARPAQSWWRQEEILAAAAVHVVARHYAAYMHAQRKETPLVCLMLVPSLSGQIRGFHEESGATKTLRCYTYTSIASESIYHPPPPAERTRVSSQTALHAADGFIGSHSMAGEEEAKEAEEESSST